MTEKSIFNMKNILCIFLSFLVVFLLIILFTVGGSKKSISNNSSYFLNDMTIKEYTNYDIPELSIRNQVLDFIELYNTLSLDRQVMNKAIIKTYHILNPFAAEKYSEAVKEQKLFNGFGQFTKEVYIKEAPMLIADDTYLVEYRVLTREFSGKMATNLFYRASVTAKVLPSWSPDMIDNPLGIYITDFNIEEIN